MTATQMTARTGLSGEQRGTGIFISLGISFSSARSSP